MSQPTGGYTYRATRTHSDDETHVTCTIADPHVLADPENITLTVDFTNSSVATFTVCVDHNMSEFSIRFTHSHTKNKGFQKAEKLCSNFSTLDLKATQF